MKELFRQVLQADPDIPVEETLKHVTILFADEDKATLDRIRHVMDSLNWKGLYVRSASEIIERVNKALINNEPLDAVVAEVNYLSGTTITGITAAREIRKAMPNVPIVFLSSYVTTSIVREEIRRVDATYVPKPFEVDTLFLRLSKLIYWYRLTLGTFAGSDRRGQSVNVTEFTRRATDYTLQTPTRLQPATNGDEDKTI